MEFSPVRVVKGLPVEWATCFRTVHLDNVPTALSYGINTIAAGLHSGNIIILDAITGSQVATLCGHTEQVNNLVFSLDGKLLVSGGDDKAVRVWDVQTGGDIRVFYGHLEPVISVSISADCTRVASGTGFNIYLWDVQTGEGITQEFCDYLDHVTFSLIGLGHLMYISCGRVYQGDISTHEVQVIPSSFDVIPSLAYTIFAGHKRHGVIVQSFKTRATVAKFHTAQITPSYCCFSPDGNLVAASSTTTTEVWNISSSSPHLVGILHDCSGNIIFSSPSSLVSISQHDKSVKFWQIGVLSAEQIQNNPKPAKLASASIVLSACRQGVELLLQVISLE